MTEKECAQQAVLDWGAHWEDSGWKSLTQRQLIL